MKEELIKMDGWGNGRRKVKCKKKLQIKIKEISTEEESQKKRRKDEKRNRRDERKKREQQRRN